MKKNIRLFANPSSHTFSIFRHCVAQAAAKPPCSSTSTYQARALSAGQILRRLYHDSPRAVWSGIFVKRIEGPSIHSASTFRSQHTSAPKSENGTGETKQRSTPSRTSRPVAGAIALSAIIAYLYNEYVPSRETKIFDPPRFTPFTIIRREEVSPTSIVLTVRPVSRPAADPDPYRQSWESGTWSVEAKQPQLQIARSYTPLPPREDDGAEDLRFLIRKEHNGEVSGYLHTLPVGDIVQLRGPNVELALSEPLKEVIFFAGGTGIAPALQLVHCLLERKVGGDASPFIRIVWANRRREDCIGGNSKVKSPIDSGYIVGELQALQQQHPKHLAVDYLVDEEGTRLNSKNIAQIISSGVEAKVEHSRLLVISGPEGFIKFFAGPKRWEGGKEGQGEIGGLLGKMRLQGWKVWKL